MCCFHMGIAQTASRASGRYQAKGVKGGMDKTYRSTRACSWSSHHHTYRSTRTIEDGNSQFLSWSSWSGALIITQFGGYQQGGGFLLYEITIKRDIYELPKEHQSAVALSISSFMQLTITDLHIKETMIVLVNVIKLLSPWHSTCPPQCISWLFSVLDFYSKYI